MSSNKTFCLLAAISLAALSLCWMSEPDYYDWQMLITNSVIGILVYREFKRWRKQPVMKRHGKSMAIVVGYVISVCVLNILDSMHFNLISHVNHGLSDANVLNRKQLDWERYILIYTILAGVITIGTSTLLVVFTTTGEE